jgi:amphi-Trp domain-containing protein
MKARKKDRDVEKICSCLQAVSKLRRLADAFEMGERFRIQIGGERNTIPTGVVITIEHECEGKMEDLEIQLSWKCA